MIEFDVLDYNYWLSSQSFIIRNPSKRKINARKIKT